MIKEFSRESEKRTKLAYSSSVEEDEDESIEEVEEDEATDIFSLSP
jgi:hypothetical protein